MNKEVKEFKASHFDNMKELLDTIKVWLENEEDYGTLYDDFNRYFDSGAMEEMYYYIKQLEAKTNQLETNRDEAIRYIKSNPNVFYGEYLIDVETLLENECTDEIAGEIRFISTLLSILERGKE